MLKLCWRARALLAAMGRRAVGRPLEPEEYKGRSQLLLKPLPVASVRLVAVEGWNRKDWLTHSSFFCSGPWGPTCSNEWPVGDIKLPQRSEGRLEVNNQSGEAASHPSASCFSLHLEKSPSFKMLLGGAERSKQTSTSSFPSWSSSRRVTRR